MTMRMFTKATASRFRIGTRPKTTQRSTSVRVSYSSSSSTTSRPRSTKTKFNRRKYPQFVKIESQESTTPCPRSTPVQPQTTSRTASHRVATRRGSTHADQSLQSTNQQLLEEAKIRDETTELSQIAFTLLQRAPLPSSISNTKPTRPTLPDTTPTLVFPRITSPRTSYISTTLPIILTTTNRFAFRRPSPFEKTKSPFLASYKVTEDYPFFDEGGSFFGQLPKHTKVLLHSNGVVQCLDQGNFPHPASCKKFISCAKMENGKVLGWEYTCPKNLSFDPIGGMCNWSAELGCDEK